LIWELTSTKRCGCERFRFNGHTAALVARGGKKWDFAVKAGKNSFTLD
jgi:hypothetical protein